MKIGIISDTHNDVEMARRAVDAFRERGITMVIHAGDLVSPDMVEIFKEFSVKFVLGNSDVDHEGILSACKCYGNGTAGRYCEFVLEEKSFFVCHGDDVKRYHEAIDSGKYDYVIHGHTHHYSLKRHRNTLVINPGAAMRDDHSDFEQTCVSLDVETGQVEKILLNQPEA